MTNVSQAILLISPSLHEVFTFLIYFPVYNLSISNIQIGGYKPIDRKAGNEQASEGKMQITG